MHNWNKNKNDLPMFSFEKNIDKILNKKINICIMFRPKHGLNQMHTSKVS